MTCYHLHESHKFLYPHTNHTIAEDTIAWTIISKGQPDARERRHRQPEAFEIQ